MRHHSAALFGLLAFAAGALAQQPAKPPATATPEQLAAHLAQWEKEMIGIKSISADCKRTDVNRVRNNQTEMVGIVKCLKVNAPGGKTEKCALLQLAEKDNPASYEKFICTGNLVYWFSPREKILYVKKLGVAATDDNFLDFLFQFKADAMKKRYSLTMTRPDDPNYVYLEIKPIREADKVEFQRARLVLYRSNYLPAQLWFEETNGNYHTWELTKVRANDPAVKPQDFVAPEKPAGWQIKEAKASEPEARPRVIRPAGQ